MKNILNATSIRFFAISENEKFARTLTAAFLMEVGVTASELADLKTVVSEAVTNAIVHAYRGRVGKECHIVLELKWYEGREILIRVRDRGVGIPDVDEAMRPFFTTDREGERSGMGLPIMQAFTDRMTVKTSPRGTTVTMRKKLI